MLEKAITFLTLSEEASKSELEKAPSFRPPPLKYKKVLATLAQHKEPSSKLEIPVFLLGKAKLEPSSEMKEKAATQALLKVPLPSSELETPSSEMKEKAVLATQALLKDPLLSSELKTPAFLSR